MSHVALPLEFIKSQEIISVTRIFQYHRKKFLLQEFDLNGVLRNLSEYSDKFKGEQILAISPSKLRYLTTPEDTEYLEVLKIKEITCKHTCEELIKQVIMSEVPIVDQQNKDTLFNVMCDLKQGLNCRFEFSFNDENMEIFLACFLPSRNLLACFVIENVKSGPVQAFPVYVDDELHADLFI